MKTPYIDGFVVAVPTAAREAYRAFAERTAAICREHGALKVVECCGDDVPECRSHRSQWPSSSRKTAAFAEVISLEPDFKATYGERGLAYYGLGDLKSARASCVTHPDFWASRWCLSVVYDKLGQHADAEAVLSKLKAALGDNSAYQYATIYAQWGNKAEALEWLETALRLPDPGLVYLKTDPLLDPLRNEPRFQAIERKLKFPK